MKVFFPTDNFKTLNFFFQQSYAHLPRQRKLGDNDRKDVKVLMGMQANKKLVQQHFKKVTGKNITLKDLHNIDKKKTSSFVEIVQELRETNGELLVYRNNVLTTS